MWFVKDMYADGKKWLKSIVKQLFISCKFFLTGKCIKNMFKRLDEYLNEKLRIQRPNMSHLIAFGMTNLQYEIRICLKI